MVRAMKTNQIEQQNRPLNSLAELKYLSRLLLVVVLLLPSLCFAKISQSIDRTDIHAGETFNLTIEIDQDNGEEPDLSLIPKDFTVISSSQYQQMTNFNGQIHNTKGWKITLSTLKSGKLLLPPITVGNESTQGIMLFIKDTDSQVDLGGKSKVIFLETTASSEQVYVQQQVILTIKLYRSINTRLARLTEVHPKDSITEKLGDDEQYYQTIDNKRYLVTKIRYAIFPQKSGKLSIDPIGFSAEVNDPNANRNSFRYLNTTRPIAIKSKAIDVMVKPMPKTAHEPWMPATSVSLKDEISQDSLQVTLGEPVTWTIRLNAQGLSESQLAEIKFPKVPGLQFYPDTPQKEREINEKGILGLRIEKVAIVPSQAGDFELPEIKINWWDTKTDSEKTATLAAKKIKVVASANVPLHDKQAEIISPVVEKSIPKISNEDGYWRYWTAFFALLWLVTLLTWLRNRKANQKQISNNISSVTKTKQQQKSYPLLVKAIKQKNSAATEKYLLCWANELTHDDFHSIGQLSIAIQDQAIIDKLDQLEMLRYSRSTELANFEWEQRDLQRIQAELIVSKKAVKKAFVPPLY